ncbi:MAG TPA: prepilin peptidase [Nocardioidaceae bacterium]|nr:prepilin peptidase [Nocardioidaceae bacterium]
MSALSPALALTTLGLLGLVVGSFLNVVIHRVPEGLSVVRPGSACPDCGHPVRARDNVPVLSWLLLRGRCRDCGSAISARYPLVELVTAALFVLVGLRFGEDLYLVAALSLVAGGVALFLIDLDRQRLPFVVTGVVALLVVAGLAGDLLLGSAALRPVALLSVALWLLVYGGVWLVTAGRGMGLGDVALAPLLGLALGWLGWGPTLVGLLGGFVVGAVVGVGLILGGRAGRRTRVPHGPFMLAGAALGLFLGQPLWSGYLAVVGVA